MLQSSQAQFVRNLWAISLRLTRSGHSGTLYVVQDVCRCEKQYKLDPACTLIATASVGQLHRIQWATCLIRCTSPRSSTATFLLPVVPVPVSVVCRRPGTTLERTYKVFWFDNASRKQPVMEVHIRKVVENGRLHQFKAALESAVHIIEINSWVEPLRMRTNDVIISAEALTVHDLRTHPKGIAISAQRIQIYLRLTWLSSPYMKFDR